MKKKKEGAVCICGGWIDHAEVADTAMATEKEFIFTCESCGKTYSYAKADIESADIELIDPDPDFLKGVDSANGKF
jgi:hypothetical protein